MSKWITRSSENVSQQFQSVPQHHDCRSRVQGGKFFAVAGAICAPLLFISSALADAGSTPGKTDKQILIENYIQSAFTRGDNLIRPLGNPSIAYSCPGDFCNSVVMRLKSDFPASVEQNEAEAPVKDDEINVIFFANSQSLDVFRLRYHKPQGSVWEFLNSGDCRIGRLTVGSQVVKVFIFSVVLPGEERKAESCVLAEVMRGTGGEFGDTYEKYSQGAEKMSEMEFERTMVWAIKNFVKLHWSMPTTPGMNSATVKKILNKHITAVHR